MTCKMANVDTPVKSRFAVKLCVFCPTSVLLGHRLTNFEGKKAENDNLKDHEIDLLNYDIMTKNFL